MAYKYYDEWTLEAMARRAITKFDGTLFYEPTAIPIEEIMERQYGLTIVYQSLRKNGRVLGETAFDDTHVGVYDKEERRYLWLPVERGTVIVDEGLADPRFEGRLRFTLAHELAHWLIHQDIYAGTQQTAAYHHQNGMARAAAWFERAEEAPMSTAPVTPYTPSPYAANNNSGMASKSSESDPRVERQADKLGSSLLMQAGQVKKAFHRNRSRRDVTAFLAELFGVSKQAMTIRLRELGLI